MPHTLLLKMMCLLRKTAKIPGATSVILKNKIINQKTTIVLWDGVIEKGSG